MNHDIEKILATFKNITLSQKERSNMRARLTLHMHASPVTFGDSSRHLLWQTSMPMVSPFMNLVRGINKKHMAPLAIGLILMLSAGGGVAFAAEGAVPGDTLYPIKVHVDEKVAGAFAISENAKANFETQLASERLEEVATLAERGKLDAHTRVDLETRFNAHVRNAEKHIEKLNATGERVAALKAEAELESKLDMQSSTLVRLNENARVGTSTKAEVRDILDTVKERAGAHAELRGLIQGDMKVRAEERGENTNADESSSSPEESESNIRAQGGGTVNADVRSDGSEVKGAADERGFFRIKLPF